MLPGWAGWHGLGLNIVTGGLIMAHELHFDKQLGRHAAFFADQPGWHGLGTVVAGARSWQEVRELAGLNWSVDKRRLFEERTDEMGRTVYRGVDAWGIFRSDTGGFLGAVGDQYKCIQNQYAFDFVDTLLEAGGAHYESAGVLRSGQRIWVLARIPGDFEPVPGDTHIPYLLFETSHDGSLAATCRLTEIRVVCNNTLTAAVAMNGSFIKIRHSGEAESKLEAARKLMGNAIMSKKALEDKINLLAEKMITKEKFLEVLDRVFTPGAAEKKQERISAKRNGILQTITSLFELNDSNAFPAIRGTCYNLLNAITEYTDHHRATRITEGRGNVTKEAARQESAIFGGGLAVKEKALEVLYEVAQTCPNKVYVPGIAARAIANGEAERANDPPAGGGLLDAILENEVAA